MEQGESLWHYYQSTKKQIPADLKGQGSTSHFNVMASLTCSESLPFSRRDYYKICLVNTDMDFQTESDGIIRIQGPSIVFCNTEHKYGVVKRYNTEIEYGYICLFNEEYLSGDIKAPLLKVFALFSKVSYPYLTLNPEDFDKLSVLFSLMVQEYNGLFDHKKEVLHGLLRLVLFESIRIFNRNSPAVKLLGSEDRLVRRFLELLDGQFPIDSPKNTITCKTPADFADKLNVHVNHLNHCLKAGTGKATRALIYERIIAEAIELLKNTDWSISNIGFSLGFEYPQHFSNFLKRNTGNSPRAYRRIFEKNN